MGKPLSAAHNRPDWKRISVSSALISRNDLTGQGIHFFFFCSAAAAVDAADDKPVLSSTQAMYH
ncbi:hypothetical protein DPMN_132080 [Dreissena polymorpha]|uniref:Uncharacterized protein n=1 Tax=Dreissena polymorpha TaxID=45954 RepID=A0A9D4JDF3_DREPO|nr:hypothetical protein DPMN_132080 [Dreissena polymorpha]